MLALGRNRSRSSLSWSNRNSVPSRENVKVSILACSKADMASGPVKTYTVAMSRFSSKHISHSAHYSTGKTPRVVILLILRGSAMVVLRLLGFVRGREEAGSELSYKLAGGVLTPIALTVA